MPCNMVFQLVMLAVNCHKFKSFSLKKRDHFFSRHTKLTYLRYIFYHIATI